MDVKKIEETLTQIGTDWERVRTMPDTVTQLERTVGSLRDAVDGLRRTRAVGPCSPRRRGRPSIEAARGIGAQFVLQLAAAGKLDGMLGSMAQRDALLHEAKDALGIEQRITSLTTSEIPLPIEYSREVRELISDYGVARSEFRLVPIGRGNTRIPRVTTAMATFRAIAMSAEMTAKSVTFGYADLASHKFGGGMTIPRELDEQGLVDIGAYLMVRGAKAFAEAEDSFCFLADGTATYDSVTGLCKTLADGGTYVVTTGGGETSPADTTIDDFRNLRSLVDAAALRNGKYYIHNSWERWLRTFNTEADPYIFVINPNGEAKLDGFPIVWTNVLQAYTESAAASAYCAVFGDLDWWVMGEHGSPRIEWSEHARFIYDELFVRFIEEIDMDYIAPDAAAVLKLAAA